MPAMQSDHPKRRVASKRPRKGPSPRILKRAWVVVLLVLASGCASESDRLRVVTWNIHHGEGTDGKVDLPRIAAVIRDLNPDIVALQEVDRGVRRTDGVDQPAELARLTGMRVIFERNIEYQGGDYGNAVLSRLPVIRWKNHPLPQLRPHEQRGALEVEVRWPGNGSDGSLRFLATHFDYRPDDKERIASAGMLKELVAPWGTTILAGDLNARPDSSTYAALSGTWERCVVGELPTYPAGDPTRQIDDVLIRPSGCFTLVEARVIKEAVASDHRPLLVVLDAAERP